MRLHVLLVAAPLVQLCSMPPGLFPTSEHAAQAQNDTGHEGMLYVRRYAMEAVSNLELNGVIYPRCDSYAQGAALAGAGAGSGAALAPGQHVPPGEPTWAHMTIVMIFPHLSLVNVHLQGPQRCCALAMLRTSWLIADL